MNPKRRRSEAPRTGPMRGGLRPGRGRPCRGWLGAAAALAITFLAVLPASADASPSRYVFEMCDSALPGGGDAGVTFNESTANVYTAVDSCNKPFGSLGIYQTSPTSEGYSYWNLPIRPPPGGTMESLTVAGQSCGREGTLAFVYISSWPPVGPGPSSGCGVEETRTFQLDTPSSLDLFWVWLGCNANSSGCAPGASVYGHYFATTEVDPVPPTLSGLGGSLLSGNVIRGHQTLSTEAHDEGGGVSNVSAFVNGLPAGHPDMPSCDVVNADNPSVHGTVATAVTPCPTKVSAEWTLDTETYPFHDGTNTVNVCTSDFSTLSNPNTTCSRPQTVNVDNSCTPSAVAGGELLSAQFSESKSDTITVGYRQGAEVSGQLASKAGEPIVGATICVKATMLGVEPAQPSVATVTTDGAGHYSYKLPPGPDRSVLLGYRNDSSQLTREVLYYAHAGPSLHVKPSHLSNHHRVHFRGQLPGPNNSGRVVVLQANVLGSKEWITFRRATTNAQGDFQSAYRFTSTTRTTTYRFRVLAPKQTGYPWVSGQSAPASVLVKG